MNEHLKATVVEAVIKLENLLAHAYDAAPTAETFLGDPEEWGLLFSEHGILSTLEAEHFHGFLQGVAAALDVDVIALVRAVRS